MIDARAAAEAPIQIVNSGPSMAPLAGRCFGAGGRVRQAIVADTGGTTYDVSLMRNGRIPIARDMGRRTTSRTHDWLPVVDVKSVGAGGGSIAWVDAGGLLHVGPEARAPSSARAYRRGGKEPTVTDACLTIGHLDPDISSAAR